MRIKSQLAEQENVLENMLSYCLVIFLCIFFIGIPQINLNDYVNSTVTSKFVCFSYGCLVILLLFVIRLLISQSIKFSVTKLDLGLFVLLLYITLNRYLFQSVYGFSLRYLELLGLSFLYLVLRIFPSKSFYWLLLSIVFSGIIQAIYGNLQLLGYYPSNHSGFKMTGSFFNPGPYAGFLAIVWPLALGMYLFKGVIVNKIKGQSEISSSVVNRFIEYSFRYVPLLGVVSVMLVIPASQSRASWIAILASTVALFEYRYVVLKRLLIKVNVYAKVLLTIFLIIGVSVFFFTVYQYKKESADGRLFVWKVTLEMITDFPGFGLGFDRFKAHYMDYQADYFKKYGDEVPEITVADNVSYAFNGFLQFLSENGLIGFVLLMIVVFLILTQPIEVSHKHLAFMLKCCVLGLIIFSSFSYTSQILPIKLILTVILALLSSVSLKKREVISFLSDKKKILYQGVVLLGGILIGCSSYVYTQKLVNGFEKMSLALNFYDYGRYDESINRYVLAHEVFKHDGIFLMNYGKVLSMTGRYNRAIKELQKAKKYLNNSVLETTLGDAYKGIGNYKKSEISYIEAAHMVPSRFYSQYLLAKLYYDSDQSLKALETAKKILEKEIKIPSRAIIQIKREMNEMIRNIETKTVSEFLMPIK